MGCSSVDNYMHSLGRYIKKAENPVSTTKSDEYGRNVHFDTCRISIPTHSIDCS